MSFYKEIEKLKKFDIEKYMEGITSEDVLNSIKKEKLDRYDFLNLLSPKGKPFLEEMARKANKITEQQFGKVISLYTPIYISNYCSNQCIYCGFNKTNKIKRKHLTFEEIEIEAREISKTGLKHILLLTGEAKEVASFDYIKGAVKILRKYFDSVVIEVYPLREDEYRKLKDVGVDGVTIYQETYDEDIYKRVHLSGEKTNYIWRLETPERGAKAGLRTINIGALFGLGSLIKEAYFSGLHGKYLSDKYLNSEFSISLPRITKAEGEYKVENILDDETFVQFMLAYRLFLPKLGITISTRERAEFRDNLIGLGVTKYSAGSKTSVGAYSKSEEKNGSLQFEISDNRSVKETELAIKKKGYQVIYKDWEMMI